MSCSLQLFLGPGFPLTAAGVTGGGDRAHPVPVSCRVWGWLGKFVAALVVLLTPESGLGLALAL